ncbi:MAG: cation transporter [Deltaproteobacteria bacterium]|nr:cation transporter [Deltaproteobacteria bacterium]
MKRDVAPGLAVGGVVSGVLASSCCLLPAVLSLVGAGASLGAVGETLSALRPVFISVAAVALGTGFYFAYRKPRGCACEANARSAKGRRVGLWIATVVALGAIVFPTLHSEPERTTVSTHNRLEVALAGMDCPSCVGKLREAIGKVPGVAEVDVDYAKRRATVGFANGKAPAPDAVVVAVRALGYDATVVR